MAFSTCCGRFQTPQMISAIGLDQKSSHPVTKCGSQSIVISFFKVWNWSRDAKVVRGQSDDSFLSLPPPLSLIIKKTS